MDPSAKAPDETALRTLDHELDIVRGAIDMVASGGAPRILISSLRFGEQLIEPARRMAIGRRVQIVPLWTTDEGGAGIAVERMSDD
jgi:hypothetical protein